MLKGKKGYFKRDFNNAAGLTVDQSLEKRMANDNTYKPAAVIPKGTPMVR